MKQFCKDVDIARFEPVLFSQLYLHSQVIARGEGGRIEGTAFSDEGADFEASGVDAGGVIYVRSGDGSIEGVYEIVSVDSGTELTISVIRSEGSEDTVRPTEGSDLVWRISTLEPQSAETAMKLCELFGIRPGNPDSQYDAEKIVDAGGLRGPAIYMVLSIVYAALASKADDDEKWSKSLYYKREFQRALENCRFSIDADGDGVADISFTGGMAKLVRE